MDLSPTSVELDAALLQAAILLGLVLLFGFLYRRYRKPYLGWWAIAWVLFGLRIGAIVSFLVTTNRFWLFAHQVLTGWTALALGWATLVFARGVPWRFRYLILLAFPVVWSYVAIYELDTFLLAALPTVIFLSLATVAPAVAFFQFRRRTGSAAAGFLSGTFLLWAIHHLDYPLLRAQGAWSPWGYYLDIGFILAIGTGTLLLMIEELRLGLRTLSAMAGDLYRTARSDALDLLLRRPLGLIGVRGSAFYAFHEVPDPDQESLRFIRGSGTSAGWGQPGGSEPLALETVLAALASRRPQVVSLDGTGGRFATILPVFREESLVGGLVIVGDLRDPFTALDEDFLLALGRQVGSALERETLYQNLAERQRDLERLSVRMIRQNEEERRRLSRELHDETAQVFSAMKMQLGGVREAADPGLGPRIDQLVGMVETGIASIRNVTNALRPTVLEDLGLVPALRALAADFEGQTGIPCTFVADELPPVGEEAELALFRALQEALNNIIRHSEATMVDVSLWQNGTHLGLTVLDDGKGFPDTRHRGNGFGLAGMQERLSSLGGTLRLEERPEGGTRLTASLELVRSEGGN